MVAAFVAITIFFIMFSTQPCGPQSCEPQGCKKQNQDLSGG